VRAYILSIGSELLQGHLTDTNATYLAQELASVGIELLHVVQCGDDRARLTNTISHALSDADLVVCTGGVGPTGDDLTREAIADAVGETPEIDPDLLTTLEAYFAGRGMPMPERNRKQAWLIPSATSLPNPVGTAPGWFVDHQGKIIVAMPGVPREMFRMWREQAVPLLLARQEESIIRGVRIKTIGIGESAAEQELGALVESQDPVIATYAKNDGVHIHVTARAATEAEALAELESGRRAVYEKLGEFIYGENETGLDEAILDAARARNLRIAIIDAGGGRFDSILAAHPSAWDVVTEAIFIRPDERTAIELARSGATNGDILSIGILVRFASGERGAVSGTIDVATAGPVELLQSLPFRGPLPELQRRSGLAAADITLRALKQIPVS
jgi:nicotinamide-nucleotide amidase